MRKFNKKALILTLVLLIVTLSLVMTGCGTPSNLEEYVNNDKELAKELESYCSPGMTVDVSDNTLTFTYAYEQTFIKETQKILSKELKNTLEMISPTYVDIRDKLEKETGFEDIKLVITYTDSEGTVLQTGEY